MTGDHTPDPSVPATRLASLTALLAVLAGGMVVVGWAFDIAELKSILPGWVSMKANTAVCFILIGIALLLAARPAAKFNPRLSTFFFYLALLFSFLVGLLTLSEYIFGWNPGIDQWLFSEPAGTVGTSHPGRMAPETALCFAMLSVALWLTGGSRKTRWTMLASVSLGLLVATLALAAMLSYLTPGLGAYGWFGLTTVAAHTSILFAMLGMAVIAISWQQEVLQWSLSGRITTMFACGMALLVFIGISTSRSQSWMYETNNRLEQDEKVQGAIESILVEVIDAQAHTRSYVITRDERFKRNYLDARAAGSKKLDELRRVALVPAEQIRQQHFVRIEAMVKAQFQWHQQVIEARRTGMTDADIVKMLGHGEAMLENLRGTFDQIQSEHQQLTRQLNQELERVFRSSYLTIFIGTLAGLLTFLIVISMLNSAVNERLQTEEALRASEEFKSSMIESSNDCIKVLDRDGMLKYMSPGGQRLLEIEGINKYLDKSWVDFWNGEDREAAREAVSKATQGEIGGFQGYSPSERGTPKWWDVVITPIRAANGTVNALLAVSRDITERKQMEKKLLTQQMISNIFLTVVGDEAFNEVLNIVLAELRSPYGVFGYIDQDGSLVIPSMTRHIWDKCQVPDKSLIFPRDTWGDSSWPRAIREKKWSYANESSARIPEGHIGISRHVSFPILFQGEVIGLFQVANKDSDYTEVDIHALESISGHVAPILNAELQRKLAEDEIRRLNAELERRVIQRTAELQAANADLESFSYSVSHDLRAPLRSISGFAELLKKREYDALDEKGRHYLDVISGSATQMGRLIDDILAFSRMGRSGMRREIVDLAVIAREVVKSLEVDAGGRDISWDIGPLPEAKGDNAMLRLVMTNLLSNALKFTRPRSRVTIKIGCASDNEVETVIYVKDNGVGFDMQYADKLFGLFQRLHKAEEFEGTGVGLANVQRIIHRHGGRVWAEGKVEEGATFYFTLPKG